MRKQRNGAAAGDRSGPDEAKKRQQDERIVLESIYGDDLVDAVPNAWKVWRPLDLILHLKPIGSASIANGKTYVSLDLHVKCPKTYPISESPLVLLENVKGVSFKDVEKLKQILDNKAKSLKGNEVILELCQIVQEFLYERNKPPQGSFFDGMLQQQAANEYERKRQRVKSEQKEREDVIEFQKMREENLMWRKVERSPATAVDDTACETFSCLDGNQKRIAKAEFNFIRRPSTSNFCREWSASDCNTGHELFVTEWTFAASTKKPLTSFKPFIASLKRLETKLLEVSQIAVSEQALCSYELLCLQKNKLTASEVNVRIVYGQNINGNDKHLSAQIDIFETDVMLLVRLAAQLLNSIQFLHEKNIGHGSLDLHSVWLTGKRNFRLSDYCLRALVSDLCETFTQCMDVITDSRSSTELDKKSLHHDLLALGDIFEGFKTLSSVVSNAGFSKNLESFIETCRNAKTVKELMDHAFLRQDDLLASLLPSVGFGEGFQQIAHSRLQNEFVFIEVLGKGGFGDVMLAKNKLDGNDYAIKRIPLDPKDERFSRKVTREAKLFSKLNHPNVVRYYNAWIEHAPAAKQSQSEKNDVKSDETGQKRENGDRSSDSLMPLQIRNIEKMAKRLAVDATSEWSTSFQPASAHDQDSVSEELPRGPVETLFSAVGPSAVESSDFEVLFQDEGDNDDDDDGDDDDDDKEDGDASTSLSPMETRTESTLPPTLRILFIQMEYCEKSTLRCLIDSTKLLKNPRQIWRLFREILQGLQYIHQEGMIHRDIKPMNILIDGNDRAKIGDFGLATREMVSKNLAVLNDSDMSSTMTKDIGTALYIAPELLSTAGGTADYTTKIDVYSLGIVLFEMFYRPLLPGMERIMTIKSLRSSAFFPPDFASGLLEIHQRAVKKLIRWMLEARPDDRPSVQNLLDSDRVPVVEIEENDFQKMFCQALRNNGGRLHNWMMDTLIANPQPPAADYLYDRNICSADRLMLPRLYAAEYVRNKLSKICSVHAFLPFDAHTFAPFNKKAAAKMAYAKSRVCQLIDENGITITLPCDLRRTFARYCVRTGVNRLKRYACGKVFGRSDALGGVHPVERVEFAIDAVGPASSFEMITAEVLCIAVEAARQLDCISSKKWELRIGHRNLIIAAALYLGFGDFSTQNKILNVLYAIATSNKILGREQKIERLRVGTEMSFNQASSLLNVLEGDEYSLEALEERTECLMNCRDDRVRENVRTALDALIHVSSLLESFTDDVAAHVLFDGTLCYRPQTYCSGIMFQLQVLLPHKQAMRPVILGAGGRYDSLLEDERHAQDPVPPNPLCAVGCSLSLDILAQLCCINAPDFGSMWCRALVCSTSDQFLKTSAKLVKQLWSRGIQADVLHDPVYPVQMMELVEHCNEKKIEVLLVVYAENEVLARIGGADLGKISIDEVLNKFENYTSKGAQSTVEGYSYSRSISHSPVRQTVSTSVTATAANLNVRYAVAEKPTANTRKRNEVHIRACLQKAIAAMASQTVIEVIVTDIPVDAIRLLATLIDRNFTVEELSSAFATATKQLNKYKKEFARIQEAIEPFFQPKNNSPVVLFSKLSSNGYYKLLL